MQPKLIAHGRDIAAKNYPIARRPSNPVPSRRIFSCLCVFLHAYYRKLVAW
jgi:hypothetical protein